MITLGENVTCSDIKEEPGEQSQGEPQHVMLNGKGKRRGSAGYGCCGIDQQPAQRRPIIAFVTKDDTYGIDAIGKVVSQHCGDHDRTDRGRNLEAEPDCKSIEKAVNREARPAEDASAPQLFRSRTSVSMRCDGPSKSM